MFLACNINRTGRLLRLAYGILMLLGAAGILVYRVIPGGGWLAWLLFAYLLLGGIFALFESRHGWCAIRAMGIRIPW